MADEQTITGATGSEPELTADDVFAQAFAQLSDADAKSEAADLPVKTVPTGGAQQRTEADRAMSEAQRDAATFHPAGPTGPSDGGATGGVGLTGGITGPSGAIGTSGDGLPPDDKEKAAAAAAAAEAAKAQSTGGISDDELTRRLAGLINKAAPIDQTQQQTTQQTQTQTQDQSQPFDALSLLTEDDRKFLTTYENEYSDISRGEALKRKVEYAQVMDYIFKQIGAAIQPRFENLETLLQRTHAADIQQTIPGYSNELRSQVVDWAAKQPTYKRVAYEYVINQGTVDEVNDLVQTFATATNYKLPSKSGATTQQVPDPAVAAVAAAAEAQRAKVAKAAASLAPVISQGTQRTQTVVSPQDYDGGFAWATRELASV